LLTDETRANEIGQRAAARVRREFGWNTVADSFAAICERALNMNAIPQIA
jgi:hypothetical protein